MHASNKKIFVPFFLLLMSGYVTCFVFGKLVSFGAGRIYIFLWCWTVAPSIAAVVFSRIGQPILGGLLTVPFGAAFSYYFCVLPRINVEIEPLSVRVLFFMLSASTACALLPAALVHCVCRRLDSVVEAKLATRLRIGALKAMHVMGVGVLCGIPVVFLLAPTPARPAPLIAWEYTISIIMLATIPLAGILGIATVLICSPARTFLEEKRIG